MTTARARRPQPLELHRIDDTALNGRTYIVCDQRKAWFASARYFDGMWRMAVTEDRYEPLRFSPQWYHPIDDEADA